MAATQSVSETCERYCVNRSNVWLPSMSCLYPITCRTSFSVRCLHLAENDGNVIC